MNKEVYLRLQQLCSKFELRTYELDTAARQLHEAWQGENADLYSEHMRKENKKLKQVCDDMTEWSEKEYKL